MTANSAQVRVSSAEVTPGLDGTTSVPKVLEVPGEATIGIVHELDRFLVGGRLFDQSDTLVHRFALKFGIRRVEALAEEAICGNEGVHGGFEVEDSACNGFGLVDVVRRLLRTADGGRNVNVGATPMCWLR